MAKTLSAFLKQNAVKVENIKFAPSKRFIDETGKPIEWELRPTDKKTDGKLRAASQKVQDVPGKKNLKEYVLDFDAYLVKFVVGSVVFPNLNDKELQDSYGVIGAENLVNAMLLPGEIDELYEKAQELNGYRTTEELKDEVKN